MKTRISSHFVPCFFCCHSSHCLIKLFLMRHLCIFLRSSFLVSVCVCGGGYLWPSPSSEQRTNDWMPFLSFSGLLNYHWVTICRGAHFVCTLIIKNIYINWSCSNFAGLRRRPPPIYFFFLSFVQAALGRCDFVISCYLKNEYTWRKANSISHACTTVVNEQSKHKISTRARGSGKESTPSVKM